MITIYLAGGMRSGWQDKVIEACPTDAVFLDPRKHGLTEEGAFTAGDLAAIRKSDIIFAYLEKDNPGGHNMALEIGYACALDKFIIYVDEKAGTPELCERYVAMLRVVANIETSSFTHGLQALIQQLAFGV